ncbi:PREDICTED: probable ribonuclease ZC3H12B isoform X2 [Dinoponera quadriceps]|uniref:Probable ribonuclease ZC3H12B isoform X2 n=1 Tax=Dinoponera quadriceps TaxID=609295 RepID=A0A6P3X8A0_DINQU|nr:PREDICTED: probable ribonuclease ZC3H12B isoform X2 [Dinoponera quadriceps]
MTRKRKRQDFNSEQCNSNLIMLEDDSLNNVRKSLKGPMSLIDSSVSKNKNKYITPKSLRKKRMRESKRSQNSKKSLQNSVIIINDSGIDNEIDSNDNDNADHSVMIVECSSNTSKTPVQQSCIQQRKGLVCSLKQRRRSSRILNMSRQTDKADNSVISVKCNPKARTPLKLPYFLRNSEEKRRRLERQQTKQLKNISIRRTRSSVILLDSDSSSSDIENSSLKEKDTNGENIAPSQTKDDIVELWSCLDKSSNKLNKEMPKECQVDQTNKETPKECQVDQTNKETPKECQVDQTKENNIYIIDKTPNWENLEYLRITNPKCEEQEKEQQCFQTKYNKYQKNEKEEESHKKGELREIIVDGCNVAMAHTNGKFFSEKGIKLMIDYFRSRGHVVKVFLPQHVRRKNLQLLEKMYKEGIVIFTPSRNIGGRWITSYDDRYILEYATKCGGIVISADQYRDLYRIEPKWRDTIINRLLTPTYVGDCIMFPNDPLGRFGPDLDTFLRF